MTTLAAAVLLLTALVGYYVWPSTVWYAVALLAVALEQSVKR